MFDLNADDGSVTKTKYESPIPAGDGDEEPQRRAGDKLDDEKHVDLHHRLLDQYVRETDRQRANRIEMATDEDFYDNIQWRAEDEAVLAERGQVALVYNVISSALNWVIGTEKRGRADFKILPRRKEDGKPAERKTQLLKYLSDVNRTPFHSSRAFTDAVIAGLGWLEDGVSDDAEGEPIGSRYENWRNIIWDSTATELDLSDARYLFRSKWVDQDVATAMFPQRQGLVDRSVTEADATSYLDDYGDEVMDQLEIENTDGVSTRSDRIQGYHRRRLRLIEGWFTMPTEVHRMKGGPFSGEIYDPSSPGHAESLESDEDVQLVKKVTMRMHVAIFTSAGMLWCSESPYRHNRYPFTPIWAYRRRRDGMPYGITRGLRGIQEDINKRASKALHIMSSSKTIMEEGALANDMSLDEYVEESARPDAVIVVKAGKKLEVSTERDLAQWQLEMMSRSIALIQSASGVTDENMGRQTNATSGVAIGKRQDQGTMATAGLFDNYRLAKQIQGEKQVSLVEQFMSEKKAFRITNMRGAPEYIEINDGLPENDIVRSKADYVISEADWRASLRQAATEELFDIMGKLPPEVSIQLLDLLVENMDLPNADEIVRRIRGVNGQRDPDAEELTPEDQQRMQAAQENAQIQKAMTMAGLRKLIAEALKAEASARQADATAVRQNIHAQGGPKRGAIDIAEAAASAPGLMPIADHILHESGFHSRSETEEAEAAASAPPPQAEPQQQNPNQQNAPGIAPGI